jgi:hypothetical protein
MKATFYIFIILLVLFSNELVAQKNFQKRKYTKGIFHETIAKLKLNRNYNQQSEIVNVKKVTNLVKDKNLSLDSSNKGVSAINLIELPLMTEGEAKGLTAVAVNNESQGIKSECVLQKRECFSTLTASTSKNIVTLKNTRTVKQVVLKSNATNTPDESFFSFVFGNFWSDLGTVLMVLAGITLVGSIVIFVLTVNAPWLYISLGVIALGAIIYLVIDNSARQASKGGEKFLSFLEKIGAPILEILIGLATGMV